MKQIPQVLMLACGALSREIEALKRQNQMDCWTVRYLPASWHNLPHKIPQGLEENLKKAKNHYSRIYVAYADCGSGGGIDRLIQDYGVERLPGAHCYEFFSGTESFETMMEEEPGTFFLTDFLVKTFEKLVIRELGLDVHPELKNEYFKNYHRLVYLAQTEDSELREKAEKAADQLELQFEYRFTGYGTLETVMNTWQKSKSYGKADQHLLA